jgi:3-oxoadipate enol-lactonase
MDQFAESDGCRISYSMQGQEGAPVLLLSNALGTTRDMWRPQMEAFTRTFRVIAYDTRGHGRSDSPTEDYTLDQLGRDALAVLDAAGARTAHVCGLSLGGLTAMWLGVNAPERVSSLVLANTAARVGSVESWTERIRLVREGGMTAVAARAMPLWFSERYTARAPEVVARHRAMVEACNTDGYIGCCAALRDADLRDAIAAVTARTLVISGTDDRSTTPEVAELIHERVRGSRFLSLDSAHLSNVEQAEAFNAAIIRHALGTDGPGAVGL